MAKFILKNGDQFVESIHRIWRYSDKTGILQRTVDVSMKYTNKEKLSQVFRSRDEVEEFIELAKSIKGIKLYTIQIEM
jgi:hypothetical protein